MRRAHLSWLVLGLATWIAAYASLLPFADAVIALLGLSRETHPVSYTHLDVYKRQELQPVAGGSVPHRD